MYVPVIVSECVCTPVMVSVYVPVIVSECVCTCDSE